MTLRPIIIISAILFAFSSCASYEEVKFTGLKNFGIAGKDKDGLKLNLVVGIDNPNNVKIKVKKADLDLKFNGRTLGNLDLDKKVVIPKNSNGTVDLLVNVQTQELLKGGLGGLLTTVLSQKAEIGVEGEIKVKAFIFTRKIPVSFTEQVKIPKF